VKEPVKKEAPKVVKEKETKEEEKETPQETEEKSTRKNQRVNPLLVEKEEKAAGINRGKPATQRPEGYNPVNRKRPPRKNKTKQQSIRQAQKEAEEKKTKRKKLVRMGGGALAVVTSIVLAIIFIPGLSSSLGFGDRYSRLEKFNCPFPKDDGLYHVLLLPFHEQPACEESFPKITDEILQRIDNFAQQGLRVSGRYLYVSNCNQTESISKTIAASCNADLIIWGTAYFDSTGKRNVLEYQYYSPSNYGENLFIPRSEDVRKVGTDDLSLNDKKLSEGIENLIHWSLSVKAMKVGDYPTAIEGFSQIKVTDTHAKSAISLMLTQCYTESGQLSKAKEEYNQLITINPNDEKTRLERAGVLSKLGEYDAALADYSKVLEINPENINALINRALLYTDQEEYDMALNDV
ncbi:MAG: tetratricopeptide repeat protein, partial [Bacteroidetes bacterium]|nr:tetratricopeptide repeat protein [Bacteroidota bacterium]